MNRVWVSCVCGMVWYVVCMPSSFVGSLFLNSNSKFVNNMVLVPK